MSFRLKTILGIALIETVLLLVLVFSSLLFLHSSNEEQLINRAHTTAHVFASATKDAVLATDLARLESFVVEILANPEIVYVAIHDGEQRLLAEGGDENALSLTHEPDHSLDDVTDDVFDIAIPIQEGGIDFGTIKIGISTAALTQVFAAAQRWVVGIAVTEIILVALFSFVLGTYLTRGLAKLRSGSRMIVEQGPGHQIEVNGKDEVAEVAQAFNSMSRSLQQTYSELQSSIQSTRAMLDQTQRDRAKNTAILSSSLDAIITINAKGLVIDFNHSAEATFGWKQHEVLGRDMAEFIIPANLREAHHKGMQNYLHTGEGPALNQRIQITAQHKAGHQFPVELAIADIQTPDGPLFTAFVRDISQQIEDQTEMRLAATTFETSQPTFITDHRARIIRVNAAFLEATGYSAQELLGQTPNYWSSGQHPTRFFDEMWTSLRDNSAWTGEIYNRRKDRSIVPERVSISAVKDEQGKITHYVALCTDISEQKSREAQLTEAMREAKKADDAKSRFLAVMSHEIRTPLNAMLGMLELLKETELDQGQRRLVATGQDSSELLVSVINDILDFSKMEAGKLTLDQRAFDLHQTLGQSVDLLRNQAMRKDLMLVLRLDESLPQFVKGDRTRLRQVLVNLISNAVKFTDEGKITVSARAEPTEADGLRLYCEVQDTGIGISDSLQKSLFQEFAMGDQSDTRNTSGTGLGLAISRRIIHLMDGQIAVRSAPNQGSCFYFEVTIGQAEEQDVPKPKLVNTSQENTRPAHLLLAEDNPANQAIFKAMLENSGHELDVVGDGQLAVEAANNKRYDLILMDVSMPRMDGITATQKIRQLPGQRGQVPIIAITAHTLTGDQSKLLAAGMNDHLPKPVRKTDLLSAIHRWASTQEEATDANQSEASELPEELQAVSTQMNYIDLDVLKQLAEDTSPEVVPMLVQGYIDDVKKRMLAVNEAFVSQNTEALEFECHTIGSSAAAHGNPELHRVARKVENLCRTGHGAEALQCEVELKRVAELSLAQLQNHIDA